MKLGQGGHAASRVDLRSARRLPEAVGAALASLVIGACGEPPARDTTPVHYSLLDYFVAAEARGPATLVDPTGAAGGPLLIQRCDSEIDYHFPMPEHARLSGHAMLRDPTASGAPTLVVRTLEPGGRRRSVLRRQLDASVGDGPIVLAEPIDSHPGELMQLRVALECSDSWPDVDLRWSRLDLSGRQPTPPPPADVARAKYNVLLILLDSLRSDHLEPYGAADVETPRIRELARGGVTLARARSTASWTRAAAASLLTSYTALNHRILSQDDRLPAKIPFLPAILERNGYHTVLITNNGMVSERYGFARGFRRVHELFRTGLEAGKGEDPQTRADHVWHSYIAPATRLGETRPFFVYLHEQDPHSPYLPPAPYDRLYTRGSVRSDRVGLGLLREFPERANAKVIETLRGGYRGEVTFMDGYVGALLDHLQEEGLVENTLVVFVSDHGEEFWEHRSVGHGHTVYEELLRVPVIMRLPGVLPEGLSLDVPSDLADVTPTILDLLGLADRAPTQGQSVLPFLDPDLRRAAAAESRAPPSAIREHVSVAQADAPAGSGEPSMTSVVYRSWKLVHHAESEGRSVRQLFDLSVDPREIRDVASSNPVVVGTLDQMRRYMRRDFDRGRAQRQERVDEPEPMIPELEANLRALGYIE